MLTVPIESGTLLTSTHRAGKPLTSAGDDRIRVASDPNVIVIPIVANPDFANLLMTYLNPASPSRVP
jgi:hypothetical protein